MFHLKVSFQAEGGSERRGVEGHQVPRDAGHVRHVQQGVAGQVEAHQNRFQSL